MTFREAATLAKSASCKELCLTHFSVAMMEPKDFIENATNVFANTKTCEDRMKFTLKFPED